LRGTVEEAAVVETAVGVVAGEGELLLAAYGA